MDRSDRRGHSLCAGRAHLTVPRVCPALKLLSAPDRDVIQRNHLLFPCNGHASAFPEGGSNVSFPNLPAPLLSFSPCRADSLSGARS